MEATDAITTRVLDFHRSLRRTQNDAHSFSFELDDQIKEQRRFISVICCLSCSSSYLSRCIRLHRRIRFEPSPFGNLRVSVTGRVPSGPHLFVTGWDSRQ